MKQNTSSYLSALLLLCILLQCTTIGFMHSHEDHLHKHKVHATVFESEVEHSDSTHECIVSEESHEEGCKVCELLHASNSQTYLISAQPGLFKFSFQDNRTSNPEIANIHFLSRAFAGRAPPRS